MFKALSGNADQTKAYDVASVLQFVHGKGREGAMERIHAMVKRPVLNVT